jgi:hypothetical protein
MAGRCRTLSALLLAAILVAIAPKDGGATSPAASNPTSGSGPLGRDRPQASSTKEETFRTAIVSVEPTRPLASPSAPRDVSGLQAVLNSLDGQGHARITLLPGHHDLVGLPMDDPCADCPEGKAHARATYGLRVRGTLIEIVGVSPDSVFIHTNAGYGIYFDDCEKCVLSGVTVTGGTRDEDPNAADGAVVVRGSTVTIEDCEIRGNLGDSAAVAAAGSGIAGIVGREASQIGIRDSRIIGNSSDGIVLYRGARAIIKDNVIDGGDRALVDPFGGGRGAGIALWKDADAEIEGNFVTHYWKGIGVFDDAHATVKQNVIEDVVLWGLALSGGAAGTPVADMRENAIFLSAGCGATIDRKDQEGEKPGSLVDNAIVRTGGGGAAAAAAETACRQEALSVGNVPRRFKIDDNLFYANREADGAAGRWDLSEPTFRKKVSGLVKRLEKRPVLAQSRFVKSFYPLPSESQ